MRASLAATALAGLALAVALAASAQNPITPESIVIDDPSLAEGLSGLPTTEEIAAEVEAQNAAALPRIDAVSLADMQADLRAVSADLQALRAELLASGAQGFAAAGGDSAIDRMNAMEAHIATLTDRTEQLSNRIRQVVADGTNRVGDIEFRLCELDPNCDLGALMTAELGGIDSGAPLPGGAPDAAPPPSDIDVMTLPPVTAPPAGATPPTEEEAREFADARRQIEAQDWPAAITGLDHLVSAHAGGPLTAEALYLLGIARQGTGQAESAAEAWLLAFSAAPDGPRAPASLLALSRAMAGLGTQDDACSYLDELQRRFPATPEAAEGQALMQEAACADLTSAGDSAN